MTASEHLSPDQFIYEHKEFARMGMNRLRVNHPDIKGSAAGQIRWDTDTGEIIGVSVVAKARRQGISTELLRRAREINPNVHHSTNLTDEGAAWAKARR